MYRQLWIVGNIKFFITPFDNLSIKVIITDIDSTSRRFLSQNLSNGFSGKLGRSEPLKTKE